MTAATTTESFFEAKYRADPDPWNFAKSEYENRRYDATMQALEGRRFRRALEPGCSIGVLTERLTYYCAAVDAFDISETVVCEAMKRCSGTTAKITHGALPHNIPSAAYDLIVFSEIGYYFEELELRAIIDRLVRILEPGGILLAAHWTGHSSDHILHGERVHDIIRSEPGLTLQLSEAHDGFILDRWERS